MWLAYYTVGWIVVVTMLPLQSFAQSQNTVPPTPSVQVPLPLPRSLAIPPQVSKTGEFMRVDGKTSVVSLAPSFASADLWLYQRQLLSVFAISTPRVPVDSLSRVQLERAQAWFERLSTLSSSSLKGWHRIPFADVAYQAGLDSIADRFYRDYMSDRTTRLTERSHALKTAIETLADPTQDTLRLSYNLARAEQYLVQLEKFPATGYATRNDSTSVLYHQLSAKRAMLLAYDALGMLNPIVAQAYTMLTIGKRLGIGERWQLGQLFPYREIVTALATQPNFKRHIDSLTTQFIAVGGNDAKGRVAFVGLLGKPAPPLQVHAILNSRDSLYQSTPRAFPFADGTVRVVMFAGYRDTYPVGLHRLHAAMPQGAEVVLVTHTTGSFGTDVLGQQDEIARLKSYYKHVLHLTNPIALWAGDPTFNGVGILPKPSSNEKAFFSSQLRYGQFVVLVDGNGIVRSYEDLSTRSSELNLLRRVRALIQTPTQ